MSESETAIHIEDVCFNLGHSSIHGIAYSAKKNISNNKEHIVLCLHGWLDNAASFLPLLPYMTAGDLTNNKRIIAIDWNGHGLSSHRGDDAHYHFMDWVYDLLQLLEHNNWHSIDIVAHSMGGMVASAFAAAFPEKVKSLTLLDSIGFITTEADETTNQLRKGLLSRLKGSALSSQNTNVTNKQTADPFNASARKTKNLHPSIESAIKARVNVSDMHYQQARLIVERGLIKEGEGFTWRADSRLRNISPYRLTLKQAEQLMNDIQCPVQLIYGSKGLDMVSKGILHFGPMIESFTSHEIIGGHHAHMEKAQEVASLINTFLAKQSEV